MISEQYWLSKEDTLKKLKPGQWIYGICHTCGESGVDYDCYSTGVRRLKFRLPHNPNTKEGSFAWACIKRVDLERGFVIVSSSQSAAWEPAIGDVCVGYVASAGNTSAKARISPKIDAEITNYDNAFPNRRPAKFEQCAIVLTCVNPLRGEVRSVAYADKLKFVSRDSNQKYLPEQIEPDQLNLTWTMITKIQTCDPSITTFQAAKNLIASSYTIAYEDNDVIFDKVSLGDSEESIVHFSFPLDVKMSAGEPPLFVALKSDQKKTNGWFVEFVGLKAKGIHKIFSTHAQIDNYNNMLKDLAELALPENWSFSNAKASKPYTILESYLCFTYYMVWFRKEFAESDDGTIRIFNTGLVNYRFKPIYGVLRRTNEQQREKTRKQWHMDGFAVAGEGQLGKEITKFIPNSRLPKRIQYISNLSDLYLDASAEISSDFPHMILDNIERLPVEMFLHAAPYGNHKEVESIVAKIQSSNKLTSKAGYEEMKKYLEEHDYYMRTMTVLLDDAVDVARSRTTWNYKTAIPVYYSARNCISLLLPLAIVHLRESGAAATKPDIALVVSRQPSGNYQGETILTLDMAYLDSRLITRPDSDWLTPEAVQLVSDDLEDGQ